MYSTKTKEIHVSNLLRSINKWRHFMSSRMTAAKIIYFCKRSELSESKREKNLFEIEIKRFTYKKVISFRYGSVRKGNFCLIWLSPGRRSVCQNWVRAMFGTKGIAINKYVIGRFVIYDWRNYKMSWLEYYVCNKMSVYIFWWTWHVSYF